MHVVQIVPFVFMWLILEIVWKKTMFVTKILANKGRRALLFIIKLVQMPVSVSTRLHSNLQITHCWFTKTIQNIFVSHEVEQFWNYWKQSHRLWTIIHLFRLALLCRGIICKVLFANFHNGLEGVNICWVYTEMPVCFGGERGRRGGGEGVAEWEREP